MGIGRYIAGGTLIAGLATFVGNQGWEILQKAERKSDHAVELAGEAHHKVDLVDQRQQNVEKLLDKQEDYNRRLLKVLEEDRAARETRPTAEPTP